MPLKQKVAEIIDSIETKVFETVGAERIARIDSYARAKIIEILPSWASVAYIPTEERNCWSN